MYVKHPKINTFYFSPLQGSFTGEGYPASHTISSPLDIRMLADGAETIGRIDIQLEWLQMLLSLETDSKSLKFLKKKIEDTRLEQN